MLILKDYQQRVLESIENYFKQCLTLEERGDENPADTAFYQVTRNSFDRGLPYTPVTQLPGLPYICLRVPTGGGKTLIACHAVELSRRFVQAEHAVILWLAPSTTIVDQTLNALKDSEHPYHQALQSEVGMFQVMDISEALSVQPATLKAETVIIVSTMQAFRVEESSTYNVYKENGSLSAHFERLSPEQLATCNLETYDDSDVVRPSFVNLLKLYRPVVFVDEAHNMRTDLSFETLERFRPSCIIEFTATPKGNPQPSNVLHSVSAAELQNADMIKLPLRVSMRPAWSELLRDAITERAGLEEVAKREQQQTGEYLRPIMLLQAESRSSKRETLDVDVLKKALLEDFKIPENYIAVSTGNQNDIENVDLFAPDCQIRIIITVNKLREGWDCPFAYVLCSVVELKSGTAIEQLVGRILRMPKASRKIHDELNRAYAFSVSSQFGVALEHITTALVNNGFEKLDASKLIELGRDNEQIPLADLSFFESPPVQVEVPSFKLEKLPPETAAKVTYDKEKKTLIFTGQVTQADEEALAGALPKAKAGAIVSEIVQKSRGTLSRSPAERGEIFRVPQLAIRFNEQVELFGQEHYDDIWKLHECDASLSEEEFPTTLDQARSVEIDFSSEGKMDTRTYLATVHHQLETLFTIPKWQQKDLVEWLDKNIYHPDIRADEAIAFIDGAITKLQEERNFDLQELAHRKYKLRHAIERKINSHRDSAIEGGFEQRLFGEANQDVITSLDFALNYRFGYYPYSRPYRGRYPFKKHFFTEIGDMADSGEEFNCAVVLDEAKNVKHWIRNLAKGKESFRLPVAKGFFYPDFVAELHDGRVLVIEYKGAHLITADDAKMKKRIGDLWAERSQGRVLFSMPTDNKFEELKTLIG